MRRRSPLARVWTAGTAVHASVPGVYAWAVTVAPLGWTHGGSGVTAAAAFAALLSLLGGVVLERRLGARVRYASLWGFVVGCAVVWAIAPNAGGAARIDGAREIAGILGWGLFAFAFAAPALRGARGEDGDRGDREEGGDAGSERAVGDPTLRPHRRLARGDGFYVAGGAVLAAGLQLVGLDVANAERALLVRFVALAAGLAMIGACTELAFARHAMRAPRLPRARFRSLFALLVLLTILLLAGVLVADQGG